MYNEAGKKKFIESINTDQYPERFWELSFEKVEPMENTYEKDFYDFSKKEIMTFYKSLDSKSFDYIRTCNYNYIRYCQWALQQALVEDGQNHFAELTVEDISSCVNKFGIEESIMKKEDVYELLNRFVNAKDRFIVLALFEGIKGSAYKEIIKANYYDIDIKNKKMKVSSGRTVDVSDDLIRIAGEADREQEYIMPQGRKFNLYGETGSLYKSVRRDLSESNAVKLFAKALRQVFDGLNVSRYITPNSIYASGLINKINEFAKEDGVSAAEVLKDEDRLKYLKNQYGYAKEINSRFIMKYKDFLV